MQCLSVSGCGVVTINIPFLARLKSPGHTKSVIIQRRASKNCAFLSHCFIHTIQEERNKTNTRAQGSELNKLPNESWSTNPAYPNAQINQHKLIRTLISLE